MDALCPLCGSSKVVKQGFRYNKSGTKQKHQCKECGHHFVIDDGFKRMRFKPETIVRAVHMHTDGLSLSKVRNHLYQHDDVRVSRWTICQWVRRYSEAIKKNSIQRLDRR